MKKLKDFLYDFNDILIAFFILVIAALLIIWRMHAIIEYPKTLVGDDNTTVTEPAGDDSEGKSDNSPTVSGDDKTSDSDKDDESNSNPDEGETTDQPAELWADGMLARDLEVTVAGDSAAEALQCLIDAGLFKDYAEYQAACTTLGIDHQKVSAGTFTFKKGASKTDIAKAVNWS